MFESGLFMLICQTKRAASKSRAHGEPTIGQDSYKVVLLK